MNVDQLATQSDYDSEIAYWLTAYRSKAPGDLEKMFSSTRPLDAELARWLRKSDLVKAARVLDVGCGPISVLGWYDPDITIDLTGVDPLAGRYSDLLREFDFQVPYETVSAGGEQLVSVFGNQSFDYVFSRNALDHSFDASLVVGNMVAVTAFGGLIRLELFEDEAVAAGYSGLHRWNFHQLDEQVLIWNRTKAFLLDDIVRPYPYTLDVIPKDDGSNRQVLIIQIHKVDLSRGTPFRVDNVADIYFDFDRRFVTIQANGLKEEHKFFLHVHGKTSAGASKTISQTHAWPSGEQVFNLKLPLMHQIDSVSIGQYEIIFEDDGHRYHNFWIADLNPGA